MAYRYIFTSACVRDVEDLARKRQYAMLIRLLVADLPAILADPQGAGEHDAAYRDAERRA